MRNEDEETAALDVKKSDEKKWVKRNELVWRWVKWYAGYENESSEWNEVDWSWAKSMKYGVVLNWVIQLQNDWQNYYRR